MLLSVLEAILSVPEGFLGLIDSSAFEAKVLVFGLSRLRKFYNEEFVIANKFS